MIVGTRRVRSRGSPGGGWERGTRDDPARVGMTYTMIAVATHIRTFTVPSPLQDTVR